MTATLPTPNTTPALSTQELLFGIAAAEAFVGDILDNVKAARQHVTEKLRDRYETEGQKSQVVFLPGTKQVIGTATATVSQDAVKADDRPVTHDWKQVTDELADYIASSIGADEVQWVPVVRKSTVDAILKNAVKAERLGEDGKPELGKDGKPVVDIFDKTGTPLPGVHLVRGGAVTKFQITGRDNSTIHEYLRDHSLDNREAMNEVTDFETVQSVVVTPEA